MAMEGLARTKVTLFIFLLLFSIVNVFGLPNNILMKCQSQCASNMTSSSEGGSELFCNRDCRIDQCNSGCKLYKNAADSSCPKVCASAYPRRSETSSKETATQDWIRNCGQGCMFALHTYLYNVLGAMEQPRPQRDSIGHSSVTLTWTRPHVNNVTLTFRVYVRVVHVDSGWQHHKDCEFKSEKIILTNLHPYVTYQFKVLALLSTRFIDESRETVEITTLPRGNPSTSPTITSISTPSPTVISLSWKPPVYTNGKLLSYRIYVEPVGHPLLNHTTIEIPHNATSWLLSQLKSSQPYIISMSARNAEGEGPRSTKTISTPNPGNLSAQETPYLILGSANKIVKRNILEVIDYSDTIHSLDDRTVRARKGKVLFELPRGTIKGLSLHIRRQLLLASDSAGYVLRVSLAGLNNRKKNGNDNMDDDDHQNEVRLLSDNHYPSILGARAISIDWLADKVYVASWNRITWQIHSCPLDQDLCVAVVKNVHRPITDVKVDPINGYLYYVINGAGHGLYRVDLQDITNLLMPKSPQSPRNPFAPFHPVAPGPALITGMPDLFTLVLDFSSVHLYLVNDTTKTMMSAFLDGTNMQPFHHNNINSAFKHVTSSVFYNETFIWTDNSEMYVESYESHSKIYHHNELLFFSPNYTGISIYHPTAQPIPVPSVAPDELEVLFTKDKGVIQWRPPQPLQYQGRGAWSNWTYELQITPLIEVNSMTSSTMKAVNIDKLTVDNLKPDSEYAVKIRAKSSIGFGPWSDAFIGRTLKEDGLKVLMGVEGGRIVEKEIGASSHHTAINLYNEAFDIAWHDDRVLWITADALSVTVMNVTTNSKRELTAARGAVCISFDWLGQKVYWGAWHEQEIRRADIDGVTSSSEYIQRSVAMDLAVDAVAGRLYWATQHSIETSFLNGEEHQELFAIKFFSGRQVISLALDSESSKVFWYVKGYQSQGLYMTEMMQTKDGQYFSPGYKHIGDFGTISSESGLQYFSGKLFWLTERNSLVVGDGTCNFTASVSEFSNITAFTVKHPQIHKLPNGLSKGSVRVIPDPIRSEDIKTVGEWSHFNLTWPLSREVNHGTVFYKVVVEDIGRGSGPGTLSQNWYELSGLSPYTKLDVSIQPYTVWGYADPTTVSVRSPMSEPSAPLSPEVYIKPFKTSGASASSLAADFRWDSPRSTNGLISHHVVNHWMGAGNVRHDFKSDRVSSTARHFILANLTKSQTYHFNVVACNDAGCGPPSETKTATTDAVNPVPTLLISSKKGLTMTEMAGRLNSTAMTDIALEAVTFLAHDPPRLFWMDQRGNYLYENVKDPHKELTKLNGRGRDLTIDWISRTLYIVEWTGDRESTITEFNIDTKAYGQLIVRPAVIGDLIADPYNSAVLWTETDSNGRGQMFSIDLNTRKIRVVIGSARSSRDRSRRSACSCGDSMDVSSAMAIDYASGDGSTRILFTDMNTKAIYYSDLDGCDCQKLLPLSSFDGLDTAPDMLAVDHLQVSCYSKAQGKLYSVKKSERRINIRENIPNVLDIVAFGSHLQPLPDSACLDPGAYNSTVQGLQVRDTSIELRLSAPTRPDMCKKISTPVDKYTVYYKPLLRTKPGTVPGDCQSEIATCLKENSYNTQVTLPSLIPYTPYLIQVAVSNYYTEYLSEQMGTAITIQTKSGVPSNPKVVNATALTPEKIMVRWSPPDNFNGPASQISYTVQYITTTTEGFEQKEMQYPAKSSRLMTFFLQDLRPDHTYSISIQTCPEDKFKCNMTKAVQATTFKTPLDFAFISTTHNSVEIHWKIPNNESINLQTILFSEMSPEVEPQWEPAEFIVFDKKTHEFKENITHLKPYTHYAFVIQISYDARPYDRAYYRWPLDDPFTTRTLAYIPGKPEIPIVSHLDSGAYEVSWEEPEDNGAAITQYILQYRDHHKNSWHAAYDGPKARWLVEEATLDNDHYYIFRVAAVNSMGQGQYSDNSTLFMASYGKALEGSFTTEVTIGIIVGSILLLGFFVLVVILILRKRFGRIKTHQFIIRGPDNELATLRELPHTTFQQSNTLYAISIQCTDEEIAKLPHFSRSQLVLHTFLGSGAFGEVFEGFAKNILGNESGETKCAVKTLRKSASDQEKQEFLKEALLMKNFQHDHILSLLGVCLDNDPQFIIMELMEGGDLLSFIRSCRATSTTPAKLMLPELVKICVHVARGCKYLEDMHFVHRDLAARNCLVSSKSPSDMIVKIGDFGLARDIYKNDYYRKEGEGLLPVRWMSPESLVDGFFTTQSDIWAFGVMMWEVITLGQQPYPARTNIEVLHFVRAGGKLERPERCADEMYSLMRKCWSFDAEERPCFADILSTLEEFEEKCIHMTFEEIARLSPLSVDANRELGVWTSDEEEEDESEEAAETRGLFTPKCQTITGGGSVRATQSDKAKRLSDLLGTTDKQVVDLTKIKRKRNHSDSKQYSPISSSPYHHSNFPAAGEYDRHGYLEPRGAKGGSRYLDLVNYAPELRHLLDAQGKPLVSGNGSAFTPVHVSHKGYHPSNPAYSLVAHDEEQEDEIPYGHNIVGKRHGAPTNNNNNHNMNANGIHSVDNPNYSSEFCDRIIPPASANDYPIYAEVCDARRHNSTDSTGGRYTDYHYNSPSLSATMMKSPRRKFSDQDLYSSPASYRQYPESETNNFDPRYTSLECNNNHYNSSNGNNYSYGPLPSRSRHRHSSSNSNRSRESIPNYHHYAKPGLCSSFCQEQPLCVDLSNTSHNSKMSLSAISANQDQWANNPDDVFLDSDCHGDNMMSSQHSYNSNGHQNQSGPPRSRHQVFPEGNPDFSNFTHGHVSLV